MANEENIVRFSAEEIAAMVSRGDDGTDWSRVCAKSDSDIAADMASDPAWAGLDDAWLRAATRLSSRPDREGAPFVKVDLDRDIVAFFEAESPQWRDKINSVLRSFMLRTSR